MLVVEMERLGVLNVNVVSKLIVGRPGTESDVDRVVRSSKGRSDKLRDVDPIVIEGKVKIGSVMSESGLETEYAGTDIWILVLTIVAPPAPTETRRLATLMSVAVPLLGVPPTPPGLLKNVQVPSE